MGIRAGLMAPLLFVRIGCSSVRLVDDDGGAGGANLTGGGPQAGGFDAGGAAAGRSIEVALELAGSFPADEVLVLVNEPAGALKQVLSGADLPTTVEVVDGDLVSYVSRVLSSEISSFRVTPKVYRVAKRVGPSEPPAVCDLPSMQLVVDIPEIAGAFGYTLATDTGAFRGVDVPGAVTLDVTDCAGSGNVDLLATAFADGAVISYELVQDIPFEADTSLSVSLSLAETQRAAVDMQLTDLGESQRVLGTSGWTHVLGMEATDQSNGLDLSPAGDAFDWQSSVIDPGPGYGQFEISVSAKFPSALGCHRRASLLHRGHAPPSTFSATRLAEVEPAGQRSWKFAEDAGGPGDVVSQTWRGGPDGELVWVSWEDASRPPLELAMPDLPDALPSGFVAPSEELALYSLVNTDFLERPSYAEAVSTPGAETMQWRTARHDCE